MCCSVLQCVAAWCSVLPLIVLDLLLRLVSTGATHCNTLQHNTLLASTSNTLLHTATHCNTTYHLSPLVCCSILQYIAVGLQCIAVWRSVLQCVAVCCSVLQCVAVCCSVLQCGAVCCHSLSLICCSALPPMGWLRLVGTLKLWSLVQTSPIKETIFCKREL